MHAIKTVNISKTYKNSTTIALSNISLEIQSKTIFTLLGRNGAGKTTFVRICATQLLPSSGSAEVLGFDLVREPEKIRNHISVVPQEGRPLRALTPWDHVYNWLRIRGMDKDESRRRAEKVLHDFDLYRLKDIPAMNLSGGMKQKVLVAMSMAIEAELLFLDEPTIGLDPISRRQVWKSIKEKKDEGKTVLLTTHYMDEAESLSDKIVIIDKGVVVQSGTIRSLKDKIPQNIRIDISKDGADIETLKSFGSVVDTGGSLMRIFTYESSIQELSRLAMKKNLFFSVSPITLDDVFVYLVGSTNEEENRNECEL
ncbi:MAG: ABC transporter ATP-binding protein [Thermoproteota archaeon]|nr:ABC transporter ATP-binding protein [Thermoproteota archaeon]